MQGAAFLTPIPRESRFACRARGACSFNDTASEVRAFRANGPQLQMGLEVQIERRRLAVG